MSAKTKYALITGAGSGIGRYSALALLQDGWHVALSGRRVEALDETVALAGADGARALPIPSDVSSPEGVAKLFAAYKAQWSRLDMLFNNAGMGAPPVPLEDLTVEQWQNVVNVNLTGAFLCTQEAFRIMKAQDPQGGRIINNGSISAHVPRPFSSPYTATKHAITGLTKATALDGRAYNIAGCQIDIGNAETPMTQRMKKGVLQPDGSTRVEPVMDVRNVADTIVLMANMSLDANIQTVTVMATKMPFVGRG
ncbi:MAG: SDR family oxidoreductase [Alphaproteobacteria bacterium]|nr:SDR family oxidoreductase [Alphaproteobacteria bacterium]MCB9930427.1 SDR family oxidoreductase [Alphaproteobacteria bacterium]